MRVQTGRYQVEEVDRESEIRDQFGAGDEEKNEYHAASYC